MFESVSLWGMHVADLVSLAPSALAIYAGYSAWRAQPRWLMGRRRHHAMKHVGIPKRATRRRVGQIIAGGPRTAADELNWLATAYPANGVSPAFGRSNPMPLTFALPAQALNKLAAAYAAYAADIRRGSFLGTTSVPVVEHDAAMALQTSTLLSEAASGGGSGVAMEPRHVGLELQHPRRKLDIWQLPHVGHGTLAYDLYVSYRRHRLRPKFLEAGSLGPSAPGPLEPADLETELLHTTSSEDRVLRTKFSSQHSFDGVLPRLVGWRPERDDSNGRLRLHLAMSETTYAAVLVDHYPETFRGWNGSVKGADRTAEGNEAKLLTLSTVVVSSDRMMLFAGRSRNAGSHQEQFGPAVNGNLELRARNGIVPDSGESGVPDPIRALAREASEELGLDLEPRRFQVLGIGKFSVAKENGTHVLLSVAHSDLTAEEIVAGVRNADPMEGRWELGGEVLAAPLPQDSDGVGPLLSWLLHDPRLTPHATLTGIAVVARYFPVSDEQLTHLASAPWDRTYAPRRMTIKF